MTFTNIYDFISEVSETHLKLKHHKAPMVTAGAKLAFRHPLGFNLHPEFIPQRVKRAIQLRLLHRFMDRVHSAGIFTHWPRSLVAVHMRRGDIWKSKSDVRGRRDYPDHVFLNLLSRVRRIMPAAIIHIWSDTRMLSLNDPVASNKVGLLSSYRKYRKQGMTLHLDTDEVDAWAHFSLACVFITSFPSSFSEVPAWINPFCVLHVMLNYTNEEIAECISRAINTIQCAGDDLLGYLGKSRTSRKCQASDGVEHVL